MPRRRRYATEYQETVVPSAARTTSGNSGTLTGWSRGDAPQSRLTITAASGTPSMTVIVEDSPDGVTFTTRDTYPAQTGIATVTRALPLNLAPCQRVSWTITGGTPSLTFSFQFASSVLQLV